MSRIPSVSVLMAAYNSERYVAEAVESVLAQTYTDFEFLILDDGSTDRTPKILKRYADRDPRVRLVRRPNTGLTVALNELLAIARGEFLARMDADDIALSGRFAAQVGYLRACPEVVCVGGWQQNIDAAGRLLSDFQTELLHHEQIETSIFQGMCPISHPTVMMRREVVLSVGGYCPRKKAAQDVDLWLRLGERGRLAVLPEFVLKYRYHDQAVSIRRHQDQMRGYREACEEALERRGMEQVPVDMIPWRQHSLDERFRWTVGIGWLGFGRGDRRMALAYGLKSLRLMPLRPEGWKLLIIAALKPSRGWPWARLRTSMISGSRT